MPETELRRRPEAGVRIALCCVSRWGLGASVPTIYSDVPLGASLAQKAHGFRFHHSEPPSSQSWTPGEYPVCNLNVSHVTPVRMGADPRCLSALRLLREEYMG